MDLVIKFLDEFDEKTVKLQLYPLITNAVGTLLNDGYKIGYVEVRYGGFGIDGEKSYDVNIYVDKRPDTDYRINFREEHSNTMCKLKTLILFSVHKEVSNEIQD